MEGVGVVTPMSVQGMVLLAVAFLILAAIVAAASCRWIREQPTRATAEREPLKKAA